MFIQGKGASQSLRGVEGAGGPGSPTARRPQDEANLTPRCWASSPLQPLFTALPWVNPLSVKPEMLSGRQACIASHVPWGPLIHFISLIPSDSPWLPCQSQPWSFRICTQGLTPFIEKGGGAFSFFFDRNHCWSDKTFLGKSVTIWECFDSGIQQQLQG